jgi:arsenate reductase
MSDDGRQLPGVPTPEASLHRLADDLATPFTGRFAPERLTAQAQAKGAVSHEVPEVRSVCVRNAGRSQMAAGLLQHLAGGQVHVRSAGWQPAREVDEAVVTAMGEVGVVIAAEFPQPLTDDVVRAADVVVTMGCRDACPVYPASATWTGRCATPPAGRWARSGPSARTSTAACAPCSPSSSPPELQPTRA